MPGTTRRLVYLFCRRLGSLMRRAYILPACPGKKSRIAVWAFFYTRPPYVGFLNSTDSLTFSVQGSIYTTLSGNLRIIWGAYTKTDAVFSLVGRLVPGTSYVIVANANRHVPFPGSYVILRLYGRKQNQQAEATKEDRGKRSIFFLLPNKSRTRKATRNKRGTQRKTEGGNYHFLRPTTYCPGKTRQSLKSQGCS